MRASWSPAIRTACERSWRWRVRSSTTRGCFFSTNLSKGSTPWRRVEMIPELEKATGEKFPPGDQLHTEETNEFLKKVLQKVKIRKPVEQYAPVANAIVKRVMAQTRHQDIARQLQQIQAEHDQISDAMDEEAAVHFMHFLMRLSFDE